jgi:hypothetical protein
LHSPAHHYQHHYRRQRRRRRRHHHQQQQQRKQQQKQQSLADVNKFQEGPRNLEFEPKRNEKWLNFIARKVFKIKLHVSQNRP